MLVIMYAVYITKALLKAYLPINYNGVDWGLNFDSNVQPDCTLFKGCGGWENLRQLPTDHHPFGSNYDACAHSDVRELHYSILILLKRGMCQ